MQSWYSNTSLPHILLRGLVSFALGASLVVWHDLGMAGWMTLTCVTTLLGTINIVNWRSIRAAPPPTPTPDTPVGARHP